VCSEALNASRETATPTVVLLQQNSVDQLQEERQELWVSPELLIVNRCINSETEYPHLLTLPYTD
jgi:hypothetical protein